MSNNLKDYILQSNKTILNALKVINKNKEGFLVAVDEVNKVVGVITDGDIRRAFINGANVNDSISDFIVRSFTSISVKNEISDIINIFKNESIKFLPILDENGRLNNIIQRGNYIQFY